MTYKEVVGPHLVHPYSLRNQFNTEAYRLDGGGKCTVIFIYDEKRKGWVWYPHGNPGLAVFFTLDQIERIKRRLSNEG